MFQKFMSNRANLSNLLYIFFKYVPKRKKKLCCIALGIFKEDIKHFKVHNCPGVKKTCLCVDVFTLL